MYMIIGIYKEGNEIIGLKMYDTEKKQIGMYHKEQVFNGCNKKGLVVAGLRDTYDAVGKIKKTLTYDIYNTKMLDNVDEHGHPLNNNHVRVPISTEGFDKEMKITLVDSMGKEEVVAYDELLQLLNDKKATGARKANHLLFHKMCIRYGNKCKDVSCLVGA